MAEDSGREALGNILNIIYHSRNIVLPWNQPNIKNQTGVSTWNLRPALTLCTERDKPMKSCLTGFLHGRLLDRWAQTLQHREWSKNNQVVHQVSQGEDKEVRQLPTVV